MVVLLNKPTAHKLIWSGWAIASETDYASCWDMVLDTEEDAPRDPLVGMEQVWNSVHIYLPSIEKKIGELSTPRLDLVRTLADEYLTGDTDIEDTLPSEAGVINLRKINNRYLLTGTPLSGEDDPRWYYQELYYEAANIVRIPAAMAEGRGIIPPINQPLPSPSSPITSTIDTRIKRLPNKIRFVPKVHYAMGDDGKQYNMDHYHMIWQDTYRLARSSEGMGDDLLYHFVILFEKATNTPITFEQKQLS